jgi:hypothetical protein
MLLDRFDSTKPGPYFYAKQFQAQGKFGGAVGGRMRTQHVLKKRHHHNPAPQRTVFLALMSAYLLNDL